MLRLAIVALFGWAAYRIMEENSGSQLLLPPPENDEFDEEDSDSEGLDKDDLLDEDEPVAPRSRARKR